MKLLKTHHKSNITAIIDYQYTIKVNITMNIKPFSAVYPKVELITSPESFFSNIKFQYREYRANGIYNELEEPSFYVYQITSEDNTHLGILTMTDVEELFNDKILKHEKTLASKEQHMMHLILKRKALVKPILLGYKPLKSIDVILNKIKKRKPLLTVSTEGGSEIHSLWAVKDQKNIQALEAGFSKVKKAYVGDGHHRTTTVALLSKSKELGEEANKYKQLFTAYFGFDQLQICDYNRVFDISEIISLPEFIIELSAYFDIKKQDKAGKPKKKHQISIYIAGLWYMMTWKAEYLSKAKSMPVLLDSALINKHLFNKILSIEDVRVDSRITYFAGTKSLDKLASQADKRDQGIAICIYPVTIKELTAIADKKQILPPKSTWFLPRLKSGLLAKDL